MHDAHPGARPARRCSGSAMVAGLVLATGAVGVGPAHPVWAHQAPETSPVAEVGSMAVADPVALVVRVQGDVRIHRADASVPAAAGERLLAGDRVVPESDGARALLIVRSGAQQVVDEPTTLSTPGTGAPADLFARAVATLAQAAAMDATLGGRQGMIRPIPGRSTLLAPANGLAVRSTRPTFQWTPTPGAGYELMLRPVEGGRPVVFEVGPDTVWTLPDAEPALASGDTYAWTVFVGGRRGGRPLPQQEFRVVSDDERDALRERMDAIRDLGLDPSGDGLALSALAYRELELFYDADAALTRMMEDGASLGPDLHRLHGEVRAEMGDADGARAAFDRAAGATP